MFSAGFEYAVGLDVVSEVVYDVGASFVDAGLEGAFGEEGFQVFSDGGVVAEVGEFGEFEGGGEGGADFVEAVVADFVEFFGDFVPTLDAAEVEVDGEEGEGGDVGEDFASDLVEGGPLGGGVADFVGSDAFSGDFLDFSDGDEGSEQESGHA